MRFLVFAAFVFASIQTCYADQRKAVVMQKAILWTLVDGKSINSKILAPKGYKITSDGCLPNQKGVDYCRVVEPVYNFYILRSAIRFQ